MAYCEVTDVRAMIKGDAVNAIIGGEYIVEQEDREEQLLPLIEAAVGDASAEIDGYINKRYRVPLSPVPGMIEKLAKDIAVYNLFSRSGINESSEEKNILNRYKAAIAYLTLVAKGEVDLDVPGTTDSDRAAFTVQSSPRLFSRRTMGGM